MVLFNAAHRECVSNDPGIMVKKSRVDRASDQDRRARGQKKLVRNHWEGSRRLKAWDWMAVDHKEREYWLTPSKDVFEFALQLSRCGKKKIYDLGCGIGRNLFLLIEMGFDVCGSDYSLDTVKEVNRRLEEIKYPRRVKHESMTEISEPDEAYDAVVAYNVVYHSYVADMRKTLGHIHRILKPGGSLLITFQSKRSPSYIKKEEAEPGTVTKKEGSEAGIPHHFVDRNELFEMLSGYRILELNHVEHEYDELKSKSCHFIAIALEL